jgi:repressor LexA
MNRFKEQRLLHGFKSQDSLAKYLYVNQTAVSQWERGVTTPSPTMLIKLSELYGVSTDYLLGNDGMPTSSPPKSVQIPVLGDVAAGIPIEAIENILDYEEIDPSMIAHGEEYFGLRIKGQSMEPRMLEGDVVIVRKQSDVDTGSVAVVLVNGDSATVKKIKKTESGLMLIPFNPTYDTMFYSQEQIASLPVTILGKVVELRGKF